MSVALLGETMPDYFGTFDVAMFSLFSVTGGEPWPETLPRLNEDGTANWGVMLFCSGYFVITTWLILQVPGSLFPEFLRRVKCLPACEIEEDHHWVVERRELRGGGSAGELYCASG